MAGEFRIAKRPRTESDVSSQGNIQKVTKSEGL